MKILYHDDRVIVCVKPAGVLSTEGPGGMPSLLRQALGEPDAVIRGVHRLDRVVGGVMVYARTRRAAADIAAQISDGRFHKEYRAVVHGRPAQTQGRLLDWLHRDTTRRVTLVVPQGSPQSQRAELSYEVIGERDGLSLLSVLLHTGRTHQIRCQLAEHGMPIYGDGKYGAPVRAEHIALYSHMIEFLHPRTGGWMRFMDGTEYLYPFDLFANEING